MGQTSYGLDKFIRQIKWIVSPPKIDPVLNRRAAMLSAIRQVVDRELTEQQRTAINLCVFDGHSVTEAAEIMGLNKSTVSRHLSRGRERIEQALRYSFLPLWKE